MLFTPQPTYSRIHVPSTDILAHWGFPQFYSASGKYKPTKYYHLHSFYTHPTYGLLSFPAITGGLGFVETDKHKAAYIQQEERID